MDILFEANKSSKEILTFYLFDEDLIFNGAIRGYGGYYSGGFVRKDSVYIQSKTNLFSFIDLKLEALKDKINELIDLIYTSKEVKVVTPQVNIKFPVRCKQ